MRGQTQIVTYAPDGTQPRWLSQYGSYDGVQLGWSTPGGCATLACTFRRPPRWRNDALNPGRLVRACRGGSFVWKGILDEPVPAADGWAVTATGAAAAAQDYLGIYSVAWGTGVFNDAVDQAIARGLDWVRVTNIGAVSGLWTGQQVDSGAQSIIDLLNLGCNKGGLTWTVQTAPQGNLLTVYALPATPNRVLVSGNPEARSIGAGPSDLYIRYQASADAAGAATYALTSVSNPTDRAQHGRRESLMDISSAGVYTAGLAQTQGNLVLKRWQRSGFSDPFTVAQGELLSQGGQEVDLGSFWQADCQPAMVCELWLADYSYGGEQTPGVSKFMVGSYLWDEDSGTAVITPFDNARRDFASVLQAGIDATPVRVQATTTTKAKVLPGLKVRG
jgi:hypothetical protein